jgi:hypothetical protein
MPHRMPHATHMLQALSVWVSLSGGHKRADARGQGVSHSREYPPGAGNPDPLVLPLTDNAIYFHRHPFTIKPEEATRNFNILNIFNFDDLRPTYFKLQGQ